MQDQFGGGTGQQPMAPPPPTQAPPEMSGQNQEMLARLAQQIAIVKSGGNWFYWIAGMSLINSIASMLQSSWGFAIGLSATKMVDEVAAEVGGAAFAVAFVINLIIAGIYVVFGYFACRRVRWVIIVGMVFFFLDALPFMLVGRWISFAFHGVALYFIFKGLQADGVARQIEEELRRMAFMQSQPSEPNTPNPL